MSAGAAMGALRVWEQIQLSANEKVRSYQKYEEIPDPELWVYRDRTSALLRRYFRVSIEAGRLPSVLGREFFRLRVKSERAYTFEDSVIFVRDVERSLEKLDSFSQHLLVWVVLHGLSQEETAKVLRCTRRTVARHLPVALDKLSQIC